MESTIAITLKNRIFLEKYLNEISLENLNKIPTPFKNNIFWNIAHTVATQQIIIYTLSRQQPTIPQTFIDEFKKGTAPTRIYTTQDVQYLKSILHTTIQQTQTDFNLQKFQNYTPYTTSAGIELHNINHALAFNTYHEGLHIGTIMQLLKFI